MWNPCNSRTEAFGTTTPVDSYPGGIFHQKALLPMPNHILSIVGYGHDSSVNKSIGFYETPGERIGVKMDMQKFKWAVTI